MTEPAVVWCGWCPDVLPNDDRTWYGHFAARHKIDGYSVHYVEPGGDGECRS
jgi:hypothetical protein